MTKQDKLNNEIANLLSNKNNKEFYEFIKFTVNNFRTV